MTGITTTVSRTSIGTTAASRILTGTRAATTGISRASTGTTAVSRISIGTRAVTTITGTTGM